jgi:hypothetical protein
MDRAGLRRLEELEFGGAHAQPGDWRVQILVGCPARCFADPG